MALIYVTGIETAGKTTACKELKKRGFEAYDIDDGIAHYYDKKTGVRSEWLESADKRTADWHVRNRYMMDRDHVQQFARQAKDKDIFLCGTTQSDDVVLDLFDRVIYLYLDKTTLKQRMAGRHAGEFAFAAHEKLAILSWHKSAEDGYRDKGAVMIDATRPVEEVTDAILDAVQNV